MSNLSFLTTEAIQIWMKKANEQIKKQIDEKLNSQETTNYLISEIKKKITEILNNTDFLQQQTVTPLSTNKKEKTVKTNSYTFDSSFDDIFKQITINGKKNNN